MKNVSTLIVVLFIALGFASCKKTSLTPEKLLVLQQTYYVPLGETKLIRIEQGSLDYTIQSKDTDIASAVLDAQTEPKGGIYIQGLKKGQTQLLLTDEVTKQQVEIDVQVVDPYMVWQASWVRPVISGVSEEIVNEIRQALEEYAVFNKGEYVVLQKGEYNQFHLFSSVDLLAKGEYLTKGEFNMHIDFGGPNFIQLIYEGEGRLSESAALQISDEVFPAFYKFTNGSFYTQKKAMNRSDIIQATSPVQKIHSLLYLDMTAHFKDRYPELEKAQLFQEVLPFKEGVNPIIGEGIL